MLSKRKLEEDTYLDSLDFAYFDPVKDIVEAGIKNATITLVGKRRSGKSVLIRDFGYKLHKHFENVYLFSGTSDVQGEFWDWIPKDNIFEGLDETAANNIWKMQTEVIKNSRETDKSKMPHVLVIFDDVITGNQGVRNSDFLAKLYSNGRHVNICSILATQSFKKVSKHVRDNTDISIAYKFKNGDDKNDFAQENFVTSSGHLREGIMDKITGSNDFHCIVVLNHINSTDLLLTVKKYKADNDVPKFKAVSIRRPQVVSQVKAGFEGVAPRIKTSFPSTPRDRIDLKVEYQMGEVEQ